MEDVLHAGVYSFGELTMKNIIPSFQLKCSVLFLLIVVNFPRNAT